MRHLTLLVALSIIIVSSCRVESPTAPPSPQSVPSLKGRLHGTWKTLTYSAKPTFVAFDSTDNRFMKQFDYAFNFTRELPGTFTVDDTLLMLNFDLGVRDDYSYNLSADTLSITLLSSSQTFGPYHRINQVPDLEGWSAKIQPSSIQTLPASELWGLGIGDSGIFTLEYSVTSSIRYLLRFDTTAGILATWTASSVDGLDAHEGYLWTAIDSMIQQRSLPNLSVVKSFSWRNLVPFSAISYHPTGLAVDANDCFLMIITTSSPYDGYLVRFTPSGQFISAVRSHSSIKDLCIANGRLFCATGDEVFSELDPSTGMATDYFVFTGQNPDAKVGGVAFSGDRLSVGAYWNQVSLYSCPLPPKKP